MTPVVHCAFGLRILVNRPVPGLTELPASPPFDVSVTFGGAPPQFDSSAITEEDAWYVSPWRGSHGLPVSRVWRWNRGDKEFYRILYDDGAESFIDRSGAAIWMRWPETLAFEDVVPYFLGQALGVVQRLRGTVCLHASAVLVDGRAIVLFGPAGSGKSSTAAAFLRQGYEVLADDVVPLKEQGGVFRACASHPRLWLQPDMVEALYGARDALPLLSSEWAKRYVDLREQPQGFAGDRQVPVAVLYRLRRESPAGEPLTEEISRGEALIDLVSNTYVNHLLEPDQRAREFATLGRLVRSVPVRCVRRIPMSTGPALLCAAILEDYRSGARGRPPVETRCLSRCESG